MNAHTREAIGLALSFAGFAATLTVSVDMRGNVREDAIEAANAFGASHGSYHECVRAYYRALDATLSDGSFVPPEVQS